MSNKLRFLAIIVVSLCTFSACTEDGDIVDPTVVLSSPNDGDAFTVTDEIELVGRATDDIALQSVIITSTLGINQTITDIADPTDFPFIFTLTLDSLTTAGDYDIVIKAVDTSNNEAESSVNITIQ